MNDTQEKIVEILIKTGNELLKRPYSKIEFTQNPEADELLNNIKGFPHAFVLASIMGRQVKAERTWLIPYEISKEIGGFEFSKLLELDLNQTKEIFERKSLHRFNDRMAKYFYSAVQRIHTDYNDDASNIWKERPGSATIVRRFLQFEGVGIKIATLAANTLARDLKIPMKDYICIDISPDVHIKKVFKRLGFIPKDASNEELMYCAREFNPEYPGIFDFSCWEIGRKWCKPQNPICQDCYLDGYCPKKI